MNPHAIDAALLDGELPHIFLVVVFEIESDVALRPVGADQFKA